MTEQPTINSRALDSFIRRANIELEDFYGPDRCVLLRDGYYDLWVDVAGVRHKLCSPAAPMNRKQGEST